MSRRKTFVKTALALLVLCAGSVFAQQKDAFTWRMGLQNCKTGDLVSFSAPVQSRTGEQFIIQINPDNGCFVYVIYQSPGGDEVVVLHSGALKKGSPGIPISQQQIFTVISETSPAHRAR